MQRLPPQLAQPCLEGKALPPDQRPRLQRIAPRARRCPHLLQTHHASCGQPVSAASFGELLDIGRLADCYGLAAVCEAVEWNAGLNLTVERAAEVLASRVTGGLARVRDASKELALSHFEAFAATDGFLRLEEQELGSLLDEGQAGGRRGAGV